LILRLKLELTIIYTEQTIKLNLLMRKQTLYRYTLTSLWIILAIFANASPYFYSVNAKKGDSIHKLLQRFEISQESCNYDKFYELNHLKSNSNIQKGKKYFLPILIYTYNGKSIRTTLQLDSWKKATRIKKYNEKIKKKGLRKMSIVDSNILWVPFNELDCITPENTDLPTTKEEIASKDVDSGNVDVNQKVDPNPEPSKEGPKKIEVTNIGRTFPIFGKKHEYVPLINNKLQGKIFYIVSGHGGLDSGAIGTYGKHKLYEDEYAYDIALRLVRSLIQHGATAYMMTRDPDDGIRSEAFLANDCDEYCWNTTDIPNGQKKRLFQRSDMVNKLYSKHLKQGIKDQTLVTIHIDSRTETKKTDIFFYHYPKKSESKKLANHIKNTIKKKYKKHRPGRPYYGSVTARDLHMLRETKPKGVYIELGNIRNPNDQKRFIIESNRQLIADWLFDSLYSY